MTAVTFRPALAGITMLWLAGCALGPEYRRPEGQAPQEWRYAAEENSAATPAAGSWWTLFNDTGLEALVQRALEANPEIDAAVARVDAARAAARIEKSSFFPAIEAGASASRFRRTRSSFGGTGGFQNNLFELPIDLSYEVDIWGRVRRSLEAARAQAESVEAAYETVRLTLSADVARTYFMLRQLKSEEEVLLDALALRREAYRLMQQRLDAGISDEFNLVRAHTEVAAVEVELEALKLRRAEFTTALAVLTGAPAAEFDFEPQPLDAEPPVVPLTLPSELLQMRPDIVQAERRMAAASARIGAAHAAFFPRLNIGLGAGLSNANLEELVDWESRVWQIAADASVPLLRRDRNRATLQVAEAAFTESFAEYRMVVLRAFQETENALAATQYLKLQAEAEARVVQSAGEAAAIARERYEEGLVNFLDVVDSERSRLDAELMAVRLRSSRLQAAVHLVKALGGGWEATAPAPVEQDAATKP